MEGTDIRTGNIDNYHTHDHTYYGNGCGPTEYPVGMEGSPVSCSTRMARDGNNQDQKNGTHYNYQSSTSGAGGTITNENAISPDTFCPLGWQLPYGGKGGDYYNKSKSWRYLFNTYSITYDDGGAEQSTKLKLYPFSMIWGGYYRWNQGTVHNHGYRGYYWSSTIVNNENAFSMGIWDTAIRSASTDIKTIGFSIRCVLCFLASVKRVYFYFEKQKSRAFVFFADPTRRRGALEARSHVTTCATKRSAKTPNVGFLPLQIYI